MNFLKKIFFALIISYFGISCKKDKGSPILIFISPEQSYYSAQPNDVLKFSISGSSQTTVKKFSITQKMNSSFTTTLLDSSVSTQNFNFIFEYQVPTVTQSTNITLEFILTDDNGNQISAAKVININLEIKLPKETSGHELFSSLSGKQNAYNIFTGTPLFSQSSAAASQHLKDSTTADTLLVVDTLSKIWTSPAGLKFVRFNDYDYPNASFNTIKQSYDAGIKKNFVDQVAVGDIILTRLPNTNADSGYVAIKLVYIIDDDSTTFDRYIFNIKK